MTDIWQRCTIACRAGGIQFTRPLQQAKAQLIKNLRKYPEIDDNTAESWANEMSRLADFIHLNRITLAATLVLLNNISQLTFINSLTDQEIIKEIINYHGLDEIVITLLEALDDDSVQSELLTEDFPVAEKKQVQQFLAEGDKSGAARIILDNYGVNTIWDYMKQKFGLDNIITHLLSDQNKYTFYIQHPRRLFLVGFPKAVDDILPILINSLTTPSDKNQPPYIKVNRALQADLIRYSLLVINLRLE